MVHRALVIYNRLYNMGFKLENLSRDGTNLCQECCSYLMRQLMHSLQQLCLL